jgi:anti-anti-sigma factor
MMLQHGVLRVYETGAVIVLGFGGGEIPDRIDLGTYRAEITSLLQQNQCEMLGLDLTGVKYIPSGMLGMLVSLRQQGITVQLYNPSADVREVLQITGLERLFEMHDLVI